MKKAFWTKSVGIKNSLFWMRATWIYLILKVSYWIKSIQLKFQAYRAYKKWVEIHGEEPELPGLNMTHDQLFFLNYAQIWCGSMRPEDAETKIRSSVHSPGPIRVLGPLSNSIEFSKAYGCDGGSRMNPEKKCSVWWSLDYLFINNTCFIYYLFSKQSFTYQSLLS